MKKVKRQEAKVLAVTMGDLAGVGPEIVAKALLKYGDTIPISKAKSGYVPVFLIVGDKNVLDQTCTKLGIRSRPKPWNGKNDLRSLDPGTYLVSRSAVNPTRLRMGVVDKRWGRLSMDYVRYAAGMALSGRVDGLVTAPISKEAIHVAGFPFEGHTDFLAHLAGEKNVRMMFLGPLLSSSKGPSLRVILVTVHVALSKVSKTISTESVFETIRLGGQVLRKIGVENPRIAVCGLNPHAGEAGAFGKEDMQKIRPAILAACRLGWQVMGPVPADSFFCRAFFSSPLSSPLPKGAGGGRGVDLIVAMYHDQGLIPFKMLHFDRGVNVTAGLSFVRTSPDHGTAYDIAGKGIADSTSMREAIRWALRLNETV